MNIIINAVTIHSQIAQGGRSRPLHIGVVTTQQKEERVKGIPPNLSNFFFCNFCECKSSASLKVYIVRKR